MRTYTATSPSPIVPGFKSLTMLELTLMDIQFGTAPRMTFASRFWTVPAHRSPIGRRMTA
jgi:hypothetical protein